MSGRNSKLRNTCMFFSVSDGQCYQKTCTLAIRRIEYGAKLHGASFSHLRQHIKQVLRSTVHLLLVYRAFDLLFLELLAFQCLLWCYINRLFGHEQRVWFLLFFVV